MPKLLLTKRNIDSKKHVPPVEEGRVDYFDEEISGLVLRVGKTSKEFYVQVDVKDPVTGKYKTVSFRHATETSKKSYMVPLSKQSKTILERRKESAEEGQDYVFPAQHVRNKHEHLILRSDDLKDRTGMDITPHGLRRTFITTGDRLRMRREDINSLTGHVDSSVTGKHCAKTTPDDLKPVLQVIDNEIERLMIEGRGGRGYLCTPPAWRQAGFCLEWSSALKL